jgi:hypothetical protein
LVPVDLRLVAAIDRIGRREVPGEDRQRNVIRGERLRHAINALVGNRRRHEVTSLRDRERREAALVLLSRLPIKRGEL